MVYGPKSTHVLDIWYATNQAYLGITDQLLKFNLYFCVCFITGCKMTEKIQSRASGWLSEHSVRAVYEYSWLPQKLSDCKFSFMST